MARNARIGEIIREALPPNRNTFGRSNYPALLSEGMYSLYLTVDSRQDVFEIPSGVYRGLTGRMQMKKEVIRLPLIIDIFSRRTNPFYTQNKAITQTTKYNFFKGLQEIPFKNGYTYYAAAGNIFDEKLNPLFTINTVVRRTEGDSLLNEKVKVYISPTVMLNPKLGFNKTIIESIIPALVEDMQVYSSSDKTFLPLEVVIGNSPNYYKPSKGLPSLMNNKLINNFLLEKVDNIGSILT